MSDYDEPRDYSTFGIQFRATIEQANAIEIRFHNCSEWKRCMAHRWAFEQMHIGIADFRNARVIAEELAELERECGEAAKRIIDSELAVAP